MGVDADQVQFVAGNALNLPGSLPRAVFRSAPLTGARGDPALC